MNREKPEKVLRGQMYFSNLDPVIGSEQGGNRPVLIIQNDGGQQLQSHLHCGPYHHQKQNNAPVDPYLHTTALWSAPTLYGHAGADQND